MAGYGVMARARSIGTRVVEVVLAVAGLGYTIGGSDSPTPEAVFLGGWTLLAAGYLLIGGLYVRRQRDRDVPLAISGAPWRGGLQGRSFSFFFTVAASITGVGAALDVLSGRESGQLTGLITGLVVVVMISSWLLLHLGYARFYTQYRDLHFPGTPDPQLVDYLYFSFTVGVSFAASDVEVRSRRLRWHVLVHSVVSFFYNAVVLATAVGIIIGR